MKILLLILSLSLCAWICQAQTLTFGSTYYDTVTMSIPKPIYDTMPVILLVCDTVESAGHYRDSIELNGTTYRLVTGKYRTDGVFWMRGYEVSRFDGMRFKYHVAYLDNNKKRLNYLVWDAMEVKR